MAQPEERKIKEVRVSELKDARDHWLITPIGSDSEEGGSWLRKPDGTFWEVTAIRLGGRFQVEIGDQISDRNITRNLESWYREARANIDAGNTSA